MTEFDAQSHKAEGSTMESFVGKRIVGLYRSMLMHRPHLCPVCWCVRSLGFEDTTNGHDCKKIIQSIYDTLRPRQKPVLIINGVLFLLTTSWGMQSDTIVEPSFLIGFLLLVNFVLVEGDLFCYTFFMSFTNGGLVCLLKLQPVEAIMAIVGLTCNLSLVMSFGMWGPWCLFLTFLRLLGTFLRYSGDTSYLSADWMIEEDQYSLAVAMLGMGLIIVLLTYISQIEIIHRLKRECLGSREKEALQSIVNSAFDALLWVADDDQGTIIVDSPGCRTLLLVAEDRAYSSLLGKSVLDVLGIQVHQGRMSQVNTALSVDWAANAEMSEPLPYIPSINAGESYYSDCLLCRALALKMPELKYSKLPSDVSSSISKAISEVLRAQNQDPAATVYMPISSDRLEQARQAALQLISKEKMLNNSQKSTNSATSTDIKTSQKLSSNTGTPVGAMEASVQQAYSPFSKTPDVSTPQDPVIMLPTTCRAPVKRLNGSAFARISMKMRS